MYLVIKTIFNYINIVLVQIIKSKNNEKTTNDVIIHGCELNVDNACT